MLKPTNILTKRQLTFLELFSKSALKDTFYLSGGTALCGFYIPYRYSEDLDFFSKEEFNSQDIIIWMKSVQGALDFRSFDLQTSFNRNLIFLEFAEETLKTEFTYYPFSSKAMEKYLDVQIDSLEDIALNKLFTIYQNPRLRDYIDLYMIIQEKQFDFAKLRIDAKIKFDWNIDPIQLGSQLLKVKERKDIPRLIESFDYKKMEKFYEDIASTLGKEVLE